MNVSKEELRTRYAGCAPPSTVAGKIAERIRRMDEYRNAKTIFMMPSPLLFQARINCLLDGKVLLMPSPALKSGFYRVKPFSIPFSDLAYGTSLKGITLFGRKVQGKQLQGIAVDLALTGCVALDQKGGRLGEGTGFFDLSMGLLGTMGCVTEQTPVGCVAGELQMSQDDLPCESWDIGVDFLVSESRSYAYRESRSHACPGKDETAFAQVKVKPAVHWDILEKKQIRKIEPLWHLYCDLFPLDDEDADDDDDDDEIEAIPKKVSPWGDRAGS